MKKSNGTIGNRTRDLPVCSAVPQSLRHRVSSIATTNTLNAIKQNLKSYIGSNITFTFVLTFA
jgi:hypothetical protein